MAMSHRRMRNGCGVARGACLRVPVVGRDGNGAADSSPGSATSWVARNVLAPGDFAASATLTRTALPLPTFFVPPPQPTVRAEIRTTIRHRRAVRCIAALLLRHPLHLPERSLCLGQQ